MHPGAGTAPVVVPLPMAAVKFDCRLLLPVTAWPGVSLEGAWVVSGCWPDCEVCCTEGAISSPGLSTLWEMGLQNMGGWSGFTMNAKKFGGRCSSPDC